MAELKMTIPGKEDMAPLSCTMLQAGINFNLLKVDLVAAFEKGASDYTLLVMPVDGLETSNEGMTLGEVIKEVNGLIAGHGTVNEEEVKSQIEAVSSESGGKFDINKLRIILHQLYLYFNKKNGAAENTLEYAFSLEIVTKDIFGEKIGIIGIDNVFISIWNTDNQKVLDRMKMFDIQGFLKLSA